MFVVIIILGDFIQLTLIMLCGDFFFFFFFLPLALIKEREKKNHPRTNDAIIM